MSRNVTVDKNSLSYIRGRYGPDSIEYKEARQREYGSKVIDFKPKTEELESPTKPKPGETPLEFARRLAQARTK